MSEENSAPPTSTPNPALRRLDRLVGKWTMTGRSIGSENDNFAGTASFEWLPGGHFLQNTGEIEAQGFKFWSAEIIGYDEPNDNFVSTVYSSMGGVAHTYHWDFQGNTLTHWEDTSKYTGTISPDGKIIVGGWRPLEGHATTPGNNYNATMIRVE